MGLIKPSAGGGTTNIIKRVSRFTVGTTAAGWTANDCDYLCTGTSDNIQIQGAIDALPATGGEIVILDGVYNIADAVHVTKDNVSIRGNGNATILKRMFDSSVEEGVITLLGRSGCKIADLQVDGNKASYINNNNYGIYLYGSNNITITGNTCINNEYSIILDGSNNTITGNTCNNNNIYGIFLYESSNNTITGNTCNNNNYGIFLYDSSSITVSGNTCNNNNDTGIYLGGSNNTITGNTCNNNIYGIFLYGSSNITVSGNTCNNNNDTGIYLESSNNTFAGNTCNNNGTGIFLYESSNNTITGNTCIRGTGQAGDYLTTQYTIRLVDTSNNYNLIAMNNCIGKTVTNEGGTGNTLINNKFNAT